MLADFEQTMQLAAQESERHGHSYLGTEHALLGLLRASNARALLVLRSLDWRRRGSYRVATAAANYCATSGSMSGR